MMSAQKNTAEARLSQLLKGLCRITQSDAVILGLTLDSAAVKPGFLFMACHGSQRHGLDYLDQALDKGAAAVVCEPGGDWTLGRIEHLKAKRGIPFLCIKDLSKHASSIAARYYGDPSLDLDVIGFTGTNGKTSCSQFFAQALVDRRCAIVGTLGKGFPGSLESGRHTTPDAVDLQADLADLSSQGAQAVALEVSSHALDQGRTNAVRFDTAVLTNLSRDHLDYHGDMNAYRCAKQRLFAAPDLRSAVLNYDDTFGRAMITQCATTTRVIAYGLTHSAELPVPADASVWGEILGADPRGMRIRVHTSWGVGEFETTLLGRFNASNLLAVLALLLERDIPLAQALSRLCRVKTVDGRMERIGKPDQPIVVVDYAHTPDALEQSLRALREHTLGRLICVFGCGGDRDRGKRPLMGAVAERLCDKVVLTDDNPRTEDGHRIIDGILEGFSQPHKTEVDRNRARAIHKAISGAGPADLVLVAGKGHERVQQVGDLQVPFSDHEQVKDALAQWEGAGA